jgi:hypothetical protein
MKSMLKKFISAYCFLLAVGQAHSRKRTLSKTWWRSHEQDPGKQIQSALIRDSQARHVSPE